MASARMTNVAHSAGIFADMTVDGPEIGTLVIVFDRAKNLPNRRSMGKQNPYCAARLGKEAKKTDTDVRGGQTPKWDQELRFVVHDSPDYHNIKISLFSEDKKTDLIGEALVTLTDLLVPGGGKKDLWQGLTCKGKYAGELRIEMTYFDSRPKPEAPQEAAPMPVEDVRQSGTKVKRRPLPSNPVNGHITPDTIPGPPMPGRARHGPRDYRTPPRANSMPPETSPYELPDAPRPAPHGAPQMYNQQYATPPQQYYGQHDPYQYAPPPADDYYEQPDFLPQLPPSNRQRAQQQAFHAQQPPRPHLQNTQMHAHSAPAVPTSQHTELEYYNDDYHLNTDYPEPLPDVDHLHNQMHSDWQDQQSFSPIEYDPYPPPQLRPGPAAPPPPPMHQTPSPGASPIYAHPQQQSAPRYGISPPVPRQQYMPSSSPASNHYQTPVRAHPPRGGSIDNYTPSPEQGPYVTPPNMMHGQSPSPAPRSSATRPLPHRHSVAEPYGVTPPRPHPLSQEVSRARSPQPYSELPGSNPYYASRDGPPLIKPRPVSPVPPPAQQPRHDRPITKAKSSYSIQHPVRAFESSDSSPLSTSRTSPQPPLRKSVSPRPTPPSLTPSGTPYGPDSFDVHNPNSRPPALSQSNSPHNPYQIRPGTEAREEPRGPIVGWHGQEIDPSDHLPVDSWAPEPEKKTPTKTYGLGRDRDFGPRNAQGIQTSSGRISRDTVVNVRSRGPPEPPHIDTGSSPVDPPSGRNKLVKKNAGRSPIAPLGEHHNYNPTPSPHSQSPAGNPYYGGYSSPYHTGSPGGYGAPHIPPKIPLHHSHEDALAREIQSIDIGESRSRRGGSVPPPTAYMPVRSHRDRQSFY